MKTKFFNYTQKISKETQKIKKQINQKFYSQKKRMDDNEKANKSVKIKQKKGLKYISPEEVERLKNVKPLRKIRRRRRQELQKRIFLSPNKTLRIDANGQTLGRLATQISIFLRGKNTTCFSPGVYQGNRVIVTNAENILISGKKSTQKLYYRHSQRPGSLKIENFSQLKKRFPARILEKAVWGMLPKGILGRRYYKELFVYSGPEEVKKKEKRK